MPVLWRQRQGDLCEFETSLVYRASSRKVRTTQRNPVSERKKGRRKKEKKKKEERNSPTESKQGGTDMGAGIEINGA